jgi:predicted nucleic acid-binding protein
MRSRYVLDASVMAAVINMDDLEHQSCYWFFKNLHDADRVIWVVPGLIFFELQAVRARRKRDMIENSPPYARIPLYVENSELYEVTPTFLKIVWDLNLYDVFLSLKGADLLYACIAKVENIPLVTHDRDFDQYEGIIQIIRPRDQRSNSYGNFPE